MFSNLSKGNVIYGIDRRDKIKVFSGSVESITPVYANVQNNMFGQIPELRLDIVATINGKAQTFKNVPSNTAIADFGDNSCVIADNKDSLYNGIKDLLKVSENIVESAPYHQTLIPQYKDAMNEIMPGSATSSEEVKALKDEVGSLKSQLAEAISLLKQQNNKTDS